MEVESIIKKCDICQKDSTSICFQCMHYFCDSCFKLSHNDETKKIHKKEKIDYYSPFDVRCPVHSLSPMNLFCIKEKGKIIYYIIFD